jgi:hypothetical protein
MSRRTARAAGWGVSAVVLGAFAANDWSLTPRTDFRTWLAWMFSVLAAFALYLCFADPLGLWPIRRRRGIDLALDIIGNCIRLDLSNHGAEAECSAEVTSLCQPPTGRAKGRHWPIPFLEDHTAGPKRILSGQTRKLDFAIFDPAAVKASLSTGEDGADHWQFSSVPEPIGVKYYNLRNPSDVDDQEFILTVRIMNADSGNYRDWQVTVKVRGFEVVGELTPINPHRSTRARRRR